jgi:ribosome biogenesis protein MAK21
LKREPKWSQASTLPLYELLQLTLHTHPTIKLWATKLIEGELISYSGDPLLDFGLANFLDRISYKNPKSLEKVAKYASGRRMAASETPIN